MNHFIHPDTFYELNRHYQKERLEDSKRIRPFTKPVSVPTLKDRALLLSGDLFITFGNRLKSRATQPICCPQTV